MPLPWLLEVTTASLGPKMVEAGVVPVTFVELTIVKLPSSLPPIVTLATSTKLVPVMVTLVPPASGPLAGVTVVTVSGPPGAVESEPQAASRKRLTAMRSRPGTEDVFMINPFCDSLADGGEAIRLHVRLPSASTPP